MLEKHLVIFMDFFMLTIVLNIKQIPLKKISGHFQAIVSVD